MAHHKSNKVERGHYEKNANGWLNSQNHFGYEDLEQTQAIQPVHKKSNNIDVRAGIILHNMNMSVASTMIIDSLVLPSACNINMYFTHET